MAKREPGPVHSHGNILSRDQDGNEHLLSVFDHPAGMVRIADDQMVRIMSPIAAMPLILALIHAVDSSLRGEQMLDAATLRGMGGKNFLRPVQGRKP